MNNQILIYQQEGHDVEVRLDDQQETLWLSLQQISDLFERDKSVISRHFRNIFKEGELSREATVAKNATVQTEGKRSVARDIEYYNLDAIISVGYRVNSKKGTQFRIWATNTLREHLVQGYTLNKQRFEHNAAELQQALALIRKTARSPEITAEAGSGLVEIVSRYTQTFLWLQQYDEGLLTEPNGQTGGTLPNPEDAMNSLMALKKSLIERGEATELFALLREDGIASILGNLDQTVFGEPATQLLKVKPLTYSTL